MHLLSGIARAKEEFYVRAGSPHWRSVVERSEDIVLYRSRKRIPRFSPQCLSNQFFDLGTRKDQPGGPSHAGDHLRPVPRTRVPYSALPSQSAKKN